MKIVVVLKHIPSVADEVPVRGNQVDFDSVDFVLNEWDEHSLEQAALIKEAVGGTVTAIGVDVIGELDNALHLALAKGADRAVKIVADEPGADSHVQAAWLAEAIRPMAPDLILVGVQASNDVDGQIGPLLAAYLDLPYVGVVSAIEPQGDAALVNKEFAGGFGARYRVRLPFVAGVQAAPKPPRYAPVSKVRQIAQTAQIETLEPVGKASSGLVFRKVAPPVVSGHAEMIEGTPAEIAGRIVALLKERGLA